MALSDDLRERVVEAVVVGGMRGLFLKVISWRLKNRQITDEEKRSPQLAIRRLRIDPGGVKIDADSH